MRLIDTHAHLDDERLYSQIEAVLERAQEAGVQKIIAVGTTAEDSKRYVEIAKRFEPVYASVGIQPNYCHQAKGGDWDVIVELSQQEKVVALGETGLDKYWDECPFEIQIDYFKRHIELSKQTGLPFVIHMRECEQEILDVLNETSDGTPHRAVMHSFTGSLEGAKECLGLGLYISFAGMVTYKKAQDIRDVAAEIPADRILVETDSPYLSPEPKRGHRPNEPALVFHTAARVAEVRGVTLEEFANQTSENAERLFDRLTTT